MAFKLVRKSVEIIGRVSTICDVRTLSFVQMHTNMVDSGFPDVEMPTQTLPEFLEPYFDKFEKYTAIECSQTKRKYTYGEVNKRSDNFGKALRKIFKLREGDVVAVIIPNVPEYPIITLGTLKANVTITTVSPFFTSDEIERQLRDSNAKVAITDPQNYDKVKKSFQKFSKKLPVIIVKTRNGQALPNDTTDFHEIVKAKLDFCDVKPWSQDNVAMLLYSSGTTGLPKGVQLTHRNVVSNIFQINHPEVQFLKEPSDDFQEVFPATLPFYHCYGNIVALHGSFVTGAKIVSMEKFTPELYITMLKEYQNSTLLRCVPPLVLFLINNSEVKKEYLQNVNFIMSGAAPLAESDEERCYKKFGNHLKILQGYGMSESTAVCSFVYPDLINGKKCNNGTVGLPLINTKMKIVSIEDSKEDPLGPLKTGEIYLKGPQIMKGYLNRPEESKQCLTEDGWLRTGDIGHYNEDGFFFITDRMKELIKVNANQVPPAELEGLIRSFPGVSEAAVIGIPHSSFGEVPRAYVVPKRGITLDGNKLREFVSTNVAKYKRLEGGVVVVDEIPKSPSGKILRRLLKENYKNSGR